MAPVSVCLESPPIRAVVLPSYAPDRSVELRRCSSTEAALELLRGCTSMTDMPSQALPTLSRLAEQVPAFRLAFRDGREAARVLARGLHDLL